MQTDMSKDTDEQIKQSAEIWLREFNGEPDPEDTDELTPEEQAEESDWPINYRELCEDAAGLIEVLLKKLNEAKA